MKSRHSAAVILLALAMSGCATTGGDPRDPFEGYNRAVFSFNDKLDEVAVKPAAEAYRAALPQFVQTGISNFFGNLGDVWIAANNYMQGKFEHGVNDTMRFAVNSTLGIFGVLDIATEAGLPKHSEDFGQTLGKWGVASGPYFVLPLLGPSTVRDSLATPVDLAGDGWAYVSSQPWTAAGTVTRVVDLRARALDASNLLEEAALDRYVFVRDAYLQRRQSRVYDGEVPTSKYDYDIGPTQETSHAGAPASEPGKESVVKLESNGAAESSAAGSK
ncbi:MlaA family lipoprotein [Noviherbaspirillum aridicola]|uniref:Lipoprotein n=1 Tax=Noviherbaspirillum aridicola TaxID=2849687 RepID=A0ABQ4Q8F4_9BURK|nr:VacJ family lipoprotein [Noviherbaspirillum aridicola]GIZ53460.1 lipoprotein [Noviherbaspirillum aridicola]